MAKDKTICHLFIGGTPAWACLGVLPNNAAQTGMPAPPTPYFIYYSPPLIYYSPPLSDAVHPSGRAVSAKGVQAKVVSAHKMFDLHQFYRKKRKKRSAFLGCVRKQL